MNFGALNAAMDSEQADATLRYGIRPGVLVSIPLAGNAAGLLLFLPDKDCYHAMRAPKGEAGFRSFVLFTRPGAKLLYQAAPRNQLP